MPLYINDKSVFPMELSAVYKENRVIYDRATRGKSWFYLEFLKPVQAFITADEKTFYTSDNLQFYVSEG
jgi:hypothetical protein